MSLKPQAKKCECIHHHYTFFLISILQPDIIIQGGRQIGLFFVVVSPSYPVSAFRSSTPHTDYLYVHKIFLWPFL
jgi:hypothetical protein